MRACPKHAANSLRWSASFWSRHGIGGREAYAMCRAIMTILQVRACPKHLGGLPILGGGMAQGIARLTLCDWHFCSSTTCGLVLSTLSSQKRTTVGISIWPPVGFRVLFRRCGAGRPDGIAELLVLTPEAKRTPSTLTLQGGLSFCVCGCYLSLLFIDFAGVHPSTGWSISGP